ncbi:oxaloacetate decarboxylase [Methylicorpusculum sp.]|uniref:isocitrate lyase/PEP mutase family protein n=1 Tax=Methylicorpusculum sp. TaxID=2713644 RepID=UPI0027160AC2|nr:isocitrate lyase/PEP mutase family protein [Methylicorpusculum sp.]MDO8846511.1 isocitrate lyase/PEP mutase family protein [Methylicorpusculum sp.]
MNTYTLSPAAKLRQILDRPGILVMPGCHDALSARLCEMAGFETAFMSGFAVSASRLGLPDTGLISYAEMLNQGQNICNSVSIPIWGDGDTGFGNAANIKRTVKGYAQAGFACIMLEDQVAPKRCGHTQGKSVVDRNEAVMRIQAAVDARNEGTDILIMARTDARATHGIDEAIARARIFDEIGADINFLEAPESAAEMERYCREVPGYKVANLIEHGKTPLLPHDQLEVMGYKIAVYPLTLLNAAIVSMQASLKALKSGTTAPPILNFSELTRIVGFDDYYQATERYRLDSVSDIQPPESGTNSHS